MMARCSLLMFLSALVCTLIPYILARPHGEADLRPGAAYTLVSDWRNARYGRLCNFNMTMNALATKWRPNNQYPIILMDTKSWLRRDMVDIRRTWHTLDFKFLNIEEQFNSSPKNLSVASFEDVKKGKPLSDISYKRMCHFFTKGFTEVPLLMKYRYLLRLDDDTCLLDSINFDLFKHMQTERASYAYSHIWKDDSRVVEGMLDFVDGYVQSHNLRYKNPKLHASMLAMKNFPKHVPCFNTNFEIINTVRYREPALMQFVDTIVASNMIFHRRWGDAPLRFATALLFWPEKEMVRLDGIELQHSNWAQFTMTEHSDSSNPNMTGHFWL